MGAIRTLLHAMGFGTYPNCRCCKAPLKDGGYGCVGLGRGFCAGCLARIMGG